MRDTRMDMGVRRFGQVNWLGMATLAEREVRRFLAVWAQTLMAPLVTAALFLVIFTIAIGPSRGDVMGVPFIEFLAPGILMMTVIQNAFGNTSSSMTGAKVMGNIVDTLMPPLSATELLVGYLAGGIAARAPYPGPNGTCASATYYEVTLNPKQATSTTLLGLP